MMLNIPRVVYNILPHIISLIVLVFTSKRSRAPKAEGIPTTKERDNHCLLPLPLRWERFFSMLYSFFRRIL